MHIHYIDNDMAKKARDRTKMYKAAGYSEKAADMLTAVDGVGLKLLAELTNSVMRV